MLSRLISNLWSDDLEGSCERICWERLDVHRRRRKLSTVSSSECSETALDAMLSRAEESSEEDGVEMRAAVWSKVLHGVRQGARREDKSFGGYGIARWLLCREVSQRVAAHPLSKALESDDGWLRLGSAELVRLICSNEKMVCFTAALSVQSQKVHCALGNIVKATGSQPSRLEVAASGALLELNYALASGVTRIDSQNEASVFAVTEDEENLHNQESDSDDEEECSHQKVPKRLPLLCLEALWQSKGAWAQSLRAERQWHGNTAHRAPFVLAIDDLLADLGADAMDELGQFKKGGAAAAAARRCSPVVAACLGCDELQNAALEAERDGDDARAMRQRAAARAALCAAKRRLAWLIRTAPPIEIRRNWKNKESKGAAIQDALSALTAELGYLSEDQQTPETDESSDLKAKVAKDAVAADVRRAVARRLCLLLGQVKHARLEQFLSTKPELQELLMSSLVALLRSSKVKETKSSSSSKHQRALGALSFAKQATAALASAALNRVLGSILHVKSKDNACGTLLSLLDTAESSHDAANETVAALIAPIAVNSPTILRQLLQRLLEAAPGSISAVAATLRIESSSSELKRQVQSEACVAIVTVLKSNEDDIFRSHVADTLGPLTFADFMVPKLCIALARANPTKRSTLEQCLGACIMSAEDVGSALDQLVSALRDSTVEQSSAKNVEDPARAFAPQATQSQQQQDELKLAPWVRRVLDRTPEWCKSIAVTGGKRWQRAALAAARRAVTSPKDAIVIRLWGAIVDQMVVDKDCTAARLCLSRILDRIEVHNKEINTDIFDRLAPLLAVKRTAVQVWLRLEEEERSTEHPSEDSEQSLLSGPEITHRAAALLRCRALSLDENKTVATIAAECLGRLPPCHLDTSAVIEAYLEDPSEESARVAKIEVYTLCHAASVHSTKALQRGALNALFTVIVTRNLPGLDQLQEGCIHALAMCAGAQAVEAATARKDIKVTETPLIIELSNDDIKRKAPALSVSALLVHVSCHDVEKSIEIMTEELALAILSHEDEAAALSDMLATPSTAVRMACISAIAIAAKQLNVTSGALRIFADAIAYPALNAAGKRLVSKLEHQDAVLFAASWLQVLFVMLVRLKDSLCVPTVDLFGLALQAARHAQSSSSDTDVALRRNGLKLLTALLAVDDSVDDLPPTSTLQAMSTLRGLAQLDPNRELRQLAHQLNTALEKAMNSASTNSASTAQDDLSGARVSKSTILMPPAYAAVSGITAATHK